jgi:hypothetical protein
MPVTLIFYLFYLEGHITRKFTLKTKKKSMDKKLDTLARRHVSDVCKSDFGHVGHALR